MLAGNSAVRRPIFSTLPSSPSSTLLRCWRHMPGAWRCRSYPVPVVHAAVLVGHARGLALLAQGVDIHMQHDLAALAAFQSL